MRTLLPTPEAPMMKNTSPSATSNETSDRTRLSPKALQIRVKRMVMGQFGKIRKPALEMMAFKMMTTSEELTTARVVAQPTPSEPPKVERPQ